MILAISCAVVTIECADIGLGFDGIGIGAGTYLRYMSGSMMRGPQPIGINGVFSVEEFWDNSCLMIWSV